MLGMVEKDPSLKVVMIQERICSKYQYIISYRKAWKAKQKAIVRVFGDWDESFSILPKFLKFIQGVSEVFLLDLC